MSRQQRENIKTEADKNVSYNHSRLPDRSRNTPCRNEMDTIKPAPKSSLESFKSLLEIMGEETSSLHALGGLEVGPFMDLIGFLPAQIHLNIRRDGMKTKECVVVGTETVGTLKEICRVHKNIPIEEHHFKFEGAFLQDDKVLTDTGAHNDCMFHLKIGQQITVRSFTGKHVVEVMTSRNTVADLKQAIMDSEGIPSEQQRLIFGGSQLEEEHILQDIGIKNGSLVHLVLRLRGGARTKQTARRCTGGADPRHRHTLRRSSRTASLTPVNYDGTEPRVRRKVESVSEVYVVNIGGRTTGAIANN
jgi:hypothetical protein